MASNHKKIRFNESREHILKNIKNLKTYLKDLSLPSTKVLENVGDSSYVLKFPQFEDYELKLTIQIPADFNINNSTTIVRCSKGQRYSPEKLSSIQSEIKLGQNYDIKNDFDIFVRFYVNANAYINENMKKPVPAAKQKQEKNSSPPHSQAEKENKQLEPETSKLVSMKTAGDVVKRIQWDELINKNEILVGYLDRFLGIKETKFNSFDWGDIVLADFGALAIPEHRINYFKYKNEVIWDKNTRLDNVFGSTGSNLTIYDVIKKLENVTVSQEDVDLGNDEVQPVRPSYTKSSEKESSPNHFIAIQIQNEDLKRNLYQLKCDLINGNNDVQNHLVPDSSYHLTLCTLRIDTPEEMENVKQIMDQIKKDEKFFEENLPINLKFEGIGEFYNKVLHVNCKSKQMEKLVNLKKVVLDKFKAENVNCAGNYYEFVPHLTIFKIKNNNVKSAGKSQQANVEELTSGFIWKKYDEFCFGSQDLVELDLCKMGNIFELKTYPVEYSIKLS